ncbi:MAG TPA: histidine--tRNA ligase [Spirochaetota bacterium]|nr:histidine--tRNA ligase [Spirochaetota bacterium]
MLKKPPGIEDIFPDAMEKWDHVTGTARDVFRTYNYKELIIPVMEYTEVFARGLGDETDIVSKEMFTFEDRGGRSLTLRPEGTASVVRAYVENGEYNRLASCKLFYCGPMFRAERPQKGRLRQFNQFGAEFFGSENPYHDAEVIGMMDAIARRLALAPYAVLVNSIGCPECRVPYTESLKSFYTSHAARLCEDCARRLEKNPLRLLDCKNESCRALRAEAPVITAFICGACRDHHDRVKGHLSQAGVSFTEDPFLVRGLDYYTRTTFEFVTERLGGQNAFAAGGRYDGLVEQFGGKKTPAVGFAAGIERILLMLGDQSAPERRLDVYIVHSGGDALALAARTAAALRERGIAADLDPDAGGFKSQFKKADRERARLCVIVGEDELREGTCSIKDMGSGEQASVPADAAADRIGAMLKGSASLP